MKQALQTFLYNARESSSNPEVYISPSSSSITYGANSMKLTAVLKNSDDIPVWTMNPAPKTGYGKLVGENGSDSTVGNVIYYQPATVDLGTVPITVTATITTDTGAVYSGNALITLYAEEVVAPPTEETMITTSVNPGSNWESVPSLPMSVYDYFKADPNFNSSNLPESQRGYYQKSFENARSTLDSGKSKSSGENSVPFYHNDATANSFGRTNSLIYSALLELYMKTKDPQIILFIADRFDLIIQGMKNNSGEYGNSNEIFKAKTLRAGNWIFVNGKTSVYKLLESQSWFKNNPATIPHDDGTTFNITYANHPKFIYSRYYSRQHDYNWNGTDLHLHDAIPRKASLTGWAMILDVNRGLSRGSGKPTIASQMDWYFDNHYKDLSFWRWRANNTTGTANIIQNDGSINGVSFMGTGRVRDGEYDWDKQIWHDMMQHLEFDWFNYLWAKHKNELNPTSLTSTRLSFWENAYKRRKTHIKASNMFPIAPNGFQVMIGNHHMAWYKKNWGGTSNYSSAGWWIRYDNDGIPPVKAMLSCGERDMLAWGRCLANNYSQLWWGWRSASGERWKMFAHNMNGVNNKFTDGTNIGRVGDWPNVIKAVNGYDFNKPADGKDVKTVQKMFSEAVGYYCVDLDPTPDKENIRTFLTVLKKFKGKSATQMKTLTESKWQTSYMQSVLFGIAHRYGIDPATIPLLPL